MKTFYYPGKKFPSVSVTGKDCALSCPHCQGKYLKDMEDVSEPEDLYDFALKLDKRDGNGFLLSGGFTDGGRVPLDDHYSVLSKIKEDMDLLINVHTGVPDVDMAGKLKEVGIDAVSYDMIGARETIEQIYGLDMEPEDYRQGYELLKGQGLSVVPHITVGLQGGTIDCEYKALESVRDSEIMVLNSLIPSDFGTSVDEKDFLSVLEHAVDKSDANVIIGCMRERGDTELERECLRRGASGMVIPSRKTLDWAKERFKIEKKEVCCPF